MVLSFYCFTLANRKDAEFMKRVTILCFLSMMLIGCISNKELNKEEIMEVQSSKLPKVRAFQDESTRKFMYSTKEVVKGYYLFESLTEAYTMHFPEDMIVLDTLIGEASRFEVTRFLYPYKVEELSERGNELKLHVRRHEKDTDLLSLIPIYPDTDSNFVEDMEMVELDDITIYHTHIQQNLGDGSVHEYIVGIIGSKQVPQAINFDIKLGVYPKNDSLSKETLDKASDELLEILKTVSFTEE